MKRSRARILMFVLAYPIMAREVLHALHCQTLSLPSSAWVLAQLEGVFSLWRNGESLRLELRSSC